MAKKWESSEWMNVEGMWGDSMTSIDLLQTHLKINKFEVPFEMSKIVRKMGVWEGKSRGFKIILANNPQPIEINLLTTPSYTPHNILWKPQ